MHNQRALFWLLLTALLFVGGRAAAQFVVPEYHSLPGATKRLFLDFDGHDMAVPGYAPKAVTGASKGNNNSIRLTVPGHGLPLPSNPEWPSIIVKDIVGTIPGVNSTWWDISVVDSNTLELPGSAFSGSWMSGGTIRAVRKWDGAQVGELVPGSNPPRFALPTVPFSLDADAKALNAQELIFIEAAWRAVAEDFAPFNVDVTTKEPLNWSDENDFRVVFDDHSGVANNGDWWTDEKVGGRAIIGSFSTSAPNVAFVWHQFYTGSGGMYQDLLPKILGDGASHEAGHGYGFRHNVFSPYLQYVGVIMTGAGGPPGYLERTVWTSGNVNNVLQDELAQLATALGSRTEDHGASVATATAGSQSGSKCWSSGLIGQMSDIDMIRFTLNVGGMANFAVNVIPQTQPGVSHLDGDTDVYYTNLDAKLTLLDSAGNPAVDALGVPVPVANPVGDTLLGYSPRISARLNAGIYVLKIESQGLYGSVGQYTVSGTIPHPTPNTAVPQVTGIVARNSAYPARAYAFPTGSGIQLRPAQVGWVNQITISFSEGVSVQQDDLILKRGAGSGATVTFTGFSYDATTLSATWTFAPIHTDQLLVTLKGTGAGAVVDASGNLLDGEWTNPSSIEQYSPATSVFPSGNISAGGDFVFRITLLGGDLDCDGDVDYADYTTLQNEFGSGTTWAEGDCDGDGDVDLTDFGILSANYNAGTNYRNWP